MDGHQLTRLIAERRKKVHDAILANPERFCVCEICNKIAPVPIKNVCTNCHAYLFDYTREGVLAQAAISGSKPMGGHLPVLPRFAEQLYQA